MAIVRVELVSSWIYFLITSITHEELSKDEDCDFNIELLETEINLTRYQSQLGHI